MKLTKVVFLLFGVLVLSGCAVSPYPKDACENYYPELPDNEYCYRKIAEYNAFIQNPANRVRTEGKTEEGKTRVIYMAFPKFTPEAYLGILLGRGAVEGYSVCITEPQRLKLWKIFESKPPCLLWVSGGTELVGFQDYFNFRDETHLAVVTFYYKSSDREKFQAWLRQNVPVKDLPRWSAKTK